MSNQKSNSYPGSRYQYDSVQIRDASITAFEDLLTKPSVTKNADFHILVLNSLGHALVAKGDFAKAADCYSKSLIIEPYDNVARISLEALKEKDPVLQQGLVIPEYKAA